jgi:hypothetical protein
MRHLRLANGSAFAPAAGRTPASLLCYIYIDWGTCGRIDECGFDFGNCDTKDICMVDY